MLKSRDISKLRADVAVNCRTFVSLCKKEGLPVLVTETVRDAEYQASLYAKGRTEPGSIVTNQKTPSFHSDKAGLAFDIAKNVKGHEYDDAAFFQKCGAIGKRMGFTWGGDWKSIVDKPHVYLPDWGSGTGILKQKYGTFEAFKKTWAAENSTVPEQSKTVITDLKENKSGIRGLRVTASSLSSEQLKTVQTQASATPRISVCSQLINVLPTAIRGSRLRTAGCLASILLAGCARTGAGGIC